MGMLAKLIKTAISAVLLNKAMRSAFVAALIKSVKWTLQPSTRSGIMAFFAKLAKSVPGQRQARVAPTFFQFSSRALWNYCSSDLPNEAVFSGRRHSQPSLLSCWAH